MMDLYDQKDHNVHQMAVALVRHRAQIAALKQQLEDIEGAIETAEQACAWMGSSCPNTAPTCCRAPKIMRSRCARVSTTTTTTPSKQERNPWPTRRLSATSPSS